MSIRSSISVLVATIAALAMMAATTLAAPIPSPTAPPAAAPAPLAVKVTPPKGWVDATGVSPEDTGTVFLANPALSATCLISTVDGAGSTPEVLLAAWLVGLQQGGFTLTYRPQLVVKPGGATVAYVGRPEGSEEEISGVVAIVPVVDDAKMLVVFDAQAPHGQLASLGREVNALIRATKVGPAP